VEERPVPRTPGRQAAERMWDPTQRREGPVGRRYIAIGKAAPYTQDPPAGGLLERSPRTGHACDTGRCVTGNGRTHHDCSNKGHGHNRSRHRPADSRCHHRTHQSLLACGPERTTLTSAVIDTSPFMVTRPLSLGSVAARTACTCATRTSSEAAREVRNRRTPHERQPHPEHDLCRSAGVWRVDSLHRRIASGCASGQS
jgi:hypothetical protein